MINYIKSIFTQAQEIQDLRFAIEELERKSQASRDYLAQYEKECG